MPEPSRWKRKIAQIRKSLECEAILGYKLVPPAFLPGQRQLRKGGRVEEGSRGGGGAEPNGKGGERSWEAEVHGSRAT